MKKIVIIGANNFQFPLIKKAKDMGLETHVFAWEDGSVGKEIADYFYPISIVEKEEILNVCKRINPDGIATIASDLANITVQFIASHLGLVCNSDDCIHVSTNKYAMRERFETLGIDTPKYQMVSSIDEYENIMSFPVIVKPTDRSGSRSINKVETEDALNDAIKEAVEVSFEKKAIIEEYIVGEEYSCECISYKGRHDCLAITKKYTTGAPHFIEMGHCEPSGLSSEIEKKVKKEVFKALDALNIQYGASHSEFKVDEFGNIKIIEIGSRMGGDCIGSHLVQLSTGYDFTKMVIQVALGEKPDMTMRPTGKKAYVKFIFNEEDMDELERMRNDNSIDIKYVSDIVISKKQKITDSSTRYGYYIYTC